MYSNIIETRKRLRWRGRRIANRDTELTMKTTVLMTLLGAFLAATTVFAPAANAGYHHHDYKPHYVYVSHCSWVKFHDHYGHHFYKKVCH